LVPSVKRLEARLTLLTRLVILLCVLFGLMLIGMAALYFLQTGGA
jgi:hypothetical protein